MTHLRSLASHGALYVAVLLPACTWVASYPDARPEDTEEACADGIDNDLDGETDCADPDCATFCPSAAVVEPTSLLPCFNRGDVSYREDPDRPEPTCEPFPLARPVCDAGEALFPGHTACKTLGDPCGEPFQPDLVADRYVLEGQVGDNDGTIDAPYALVQRGVSEVPDGGVVSVGAGAYSSHLTIDRPMHLVGACAATTRLIGGSATQPVLRIQSPDVILEGFTLSSIGPGITVEEGASLEMRDVIIERAGGHGIHVDAATLDAEHVVIRDVERETATGLRITDGADAQVSSMLIEEIEGAGVVVDDATLTLRASALDGTGAEGLRVTGDAQVHTPGLALAASATAGVLVSCTDSTVDAPCLELEDTLLRHPTSEGAGMVVESGHVHLTRTLVDGSHQRGLYLTGGHTTLSHVAIVQTRRGPDESGTGIQVLGNAVLEGQHVRLRANHFDGLRVDGGAVTLRDLALSGPGEGGTSGVGVGAGDGASLDLARFAIDAAGLCGLQLDAGVDFVGIDGVISDAERGACVAPDAFTPGQMSTHITYAGNDRNIVVE